MKKSQSKYLEQILHIYLYLERVERDLVDKLYFLSFMINEALIPAYR